MTRHSNAEKAKIKAEFENRRRAEKTAQTKEALKTDPLYRENNRMSYDYDIGDPFSEVSYYLVRGCLKNIVLKTSAGQIFEATPKKAMYKENKSEKSKTILEFNPQSPAYLAEAPYYIRVAKTLSTLVHLALTNQESITIERNIKSPFEEEGK